MSDVPQHDAADPDDGGSPSQSDGSPTEPAQPQAPASADAAAGAEPDSAPAEPPEPGAGPGPVTLGNIGPGARAPAANGDGTTSGSDGGGGPGDDLIARVCEVELEEFEGPLDLLLHLVRRHELDILDIPIAFVCEKYLEYIDFMRTLELEVAGDYLVMAATLAYLKSRELVPRQEEEIEAGVEEEGPDPREQLIARLLEYQKFRDAARRLDERPMSGRDTFARGQTIELPPVDAGLAPITLFRLAEAYQRVLERARIHKSHEVVMETISVATRMQQLTGLLITRSRLDFEKLFLEQTWKSEAELRAMLVVTLMSVLELVRMGVASVHQPEGADSLMIERVASEQEAREALAGYDEAASFGKPGEAKPEHDGDDELDDAQDEPGLLDDADDADVQDEPGLLDDSERDVELAAEVSDEPPAGEGVAGAADPQASDDAAPIEQTPVPAPDERPSGATPPAAADPGAPAQSVVSESPLTDAAPRGGVDASAAENREDVTGLGAMEADAEEHRENGEAEAGEGP